MLRRPRIGRGLLGTALLFLGLTIASPATSPPARAASMAAGTPIPCRETPFGHVLRLNQRNQAYIGLADGLPGDTGRLYAYRLSTDPASSKLTTQSISDPVNEPPSVTALAGVAADLDGDGTQEFVQGYTDASGAYAITVRRNGGPTQTHSESWPGHSQRAMAAGDVLGRDDGAAQVVIASRDAGGALNVAIFAGDAGGGVGAPAALWRSSASSRANASQIHVAVGNLNNNRQADIVVSLLESDQHTAQLIFLEYQPATQSIQERASSHILIDRGLVSPRSLKLALASLSGGPRQSVLLAHDLQDPGGVSGVLVVQDFDLQTVNGNQQFVERALWSNGAVRTHSFDIGAGDIYGDGRTEVVIGYDNAATGTLDVQALMLNDPTAIEPKLVGVEHWKDGNNYRNAAGNIALAVGDLNRDNRAEVVLAFSDANQFGFQALYLSEQYDQQQRGLGLGLVDWGRYDSTLAGPPTLALGDWTNESLRATISQTCARVVDPNITAVGYVPPYWQHIQDAPAIGNSQSGQLHAGSIGSSVTQEISAAQSLTYNRSDTVSFYAGVGLNVDIPGIAQVTASAKQTGARTYAMNSSQSTGVVTTTVTTAGQSWLNDALIYDATEYNCYQYQLSVQQTALPLDKAHLRYCEYIGPSGGVAPHSASELDSWDQNFSGQPAYVPAARDWSSLALFRGAYADQSSNQATAARALDNDIVSGSYSGGRAAQTNTESQPWWQIDLGESQPISKIRLWTPPGSLSNVYVFVSDSDLRGKDLNTLLAQPDVRHYSMADLGAGFTMADTAPPEATLVTLDADGNPIRGRYVRVQRTDTAALTLAEVQVFGTNHVEPDRYPVDMRPGAAGSGSFQVKLYDPNAGAYEWVAVRGNLLWDGRQGQLNSLSVDRGNTITSWSLSQSTGITKVQSQELSTSTSAGLEFEGAAGDFVQVLGGGGSEQTTGLASATTLSTSWSQELNMGGQVQGFPPAYNLDKNGWVLNCAYRFQPYYYELSDTSNLGHAQRFPVLDYLVPAGPFASDLDRTTAGAMAACRNGNQLSATPQATSDSAQTVVGQPLMLSALANDLGNNLVISDVGPAQHGTVTHSARTISYTPSPGFVGTDSFSYTISASAGGTTTGTVSITVNRAEVYLPLIQR